MNTDKKKVLLVSFVTFVVLLTAFFLNVSYSKILTAILAGACAAMTFFVIKKRSALSISKREVLVLMTVVAVVYVVLKEATGIYFGFYKNPYFVDTERLLTGIIPTVVIIVASEVIRYVVLAQKNKIASVVVYLSCVLADVLIYSNVAGIINFNRFMDLFGLTLLPAISANVFYHYVSKNYGMLPNAAFRIITTLYIYFIPSTTGMGDALDSCTRILLPIVMLALVSALYSKKQKKAVTKGNKVGTASTILTAAVIISIAMLVSCQFRFGALVIATESMTGEINKGDVVIYEQYTNQAIKEGQVIVFLDNGNRIVHRVVRIEHTGGEIRYYTKGDANNGEDAGYRTKSDIVGLTDVKIAYVGFPTLWLHELMSSEN